MKEGDVILSGWSYVNGLELLKQIGDAHFISEEHFSKEEVRKIRAEIPVLVREGVVCRRFDPIQEKFHYSLNSFGEEVYESLKPARKEG
jgi:hypothetical protein